MVVPIQADWSTSTSYISNNVEPKISATHSFDFVWLLIELQAIAIVKSMAKIFYMMCIEYVSSNLRAMQCGALHFVLNSFRFRTFFDVVAKDHVQIVCNLSTTFIIHILAYLSAFKLHFVCSNPEHKNFWESRQFFYL